MASGVRQKMFASQTSARWTIRAVILAVIFIPANAVLGVDENMWGCAPLGERRTLLYLVNRGGRSYIKFSGQRAPATMTSEAGKRTWAWGTNRVTLAEDSLANYYEGNATEPKAVFRCKPVGGR